MYLVIIVELFDTKSKSYEIMILNVKVTRSKSQSSRSKNEYIENEPVIYRYKQVFLHGKEGIHIESVIHNGLQSIGPMLRSQGQGLGSGMRKNGTGG